MTSSSKVSPFFPISTSFLWVSLDTIILIPLSIMIIVKIMYITKRGFYTYMISERILYQLVQAINKNKRIEGISELSELSGIPEITIKVNIKVLTNHDNIKHSRVGSRNTHVFEYRDKTDSKSSEYDIAISNYNKIVKMSNFFIEYHLKKMRKLKLDESQLKSSSTVATEIFIDIDKIAEKLSSLKCKTRKTSSRYPSLEYKVSLLYRLKRKIHENVYRADPLLESRMMILLGSARVDKRRLRATDYY